MKIQYISDEESFTNNVLNATEPVFAVFSASWCGPCKIYKETLQEVSQESAYPLTIAIIDVDELSNITNQYNIRTVPTTIVIVNKEIKEEIKGALSKANLLEYLNKYNHNNT